MGLKLLLRLRGRLLVIAVGSLGQLGVLAAPKFYSRQQTTAMQPVGLEGWA